jgi:predicted dehydrogenase
MINVAICGFGFMGSAHARCVRDLTDARLSAIVETDTHRFDIAGKEGNLALNARDGLLEGVSIYTGLEPVLARQDIDVVDICLPVRLHYDWAKLALEAGKDVLLEKPMLLNVAQGKDLISLARARKSILMVAHVVRFMPAYRMLRTIAEAGHHGQLELLIMQRWAGEPAWGMWKDAEARRFSGGGLFDLLIHDIDMVNWLMGKPSTIDATVFGGRISEHDFVNAVWRYDHGGSAILQGGFSFHSHLPFEARFLAKFKNGTVAFDSTRPGVLSIADDLSLKTVALEEEPLDGYRHEIGYFLDCVRQRCWPDQCSPESSLVAVELALRHMMEDSHGGTEDPIPLSI